MNRTTFETDRRVLPGRRHAPDPVGVPADPQPARQRFDAPADYVVVSFTYRCCVRAALFGRSRERT